MIRHERRAPYAWFRTWFPGCLVLAAVIAAAFPVNPVFIGAAAIGSAVALAAIYFFVYRLKQFRISWILADGLLLGYSLGTFNTSLRLAWEGSTAAIQFSRAQGELSMALAATLLVSALLFFVGAVVEKPLRIHGERTGRGDLRFAWLGLAVVLAGFATGGIGYMGTVADDQNHVSMLGEIAGLWGPALPALAVLLLPRCPKGVSRAACWLLLAAAIVCLIPQGRRTLFFAVLLAFVAIGAGNPRRLSVWKHLPLIVAAVPILYVGNLVFYAMRVSSWQAGSAKLSFTELSTRAAGILRGGRDSSFDEAVDENLRDRTFVLRYFSDLLHASWNHQPLLGRDLLFSIRMAIPSVVYRDKDSVLAIGMEENLANPEFGLYATDESNSILTTGVSDFGVAGVFIYPIVLSLLVSAFTGALTRRLPEIAGAIVVFAIAGIMWKMETSFSGYLVACRDVLLLALPLAILKMWKPAGRRAGLQQRDLAAAALVLILCPHLSAAVAVNLTDFDAACGQPGHNCRGAFQKALEAAGKAGGGTVRLPAGTFPIDFPEVSNDVPSARPLAAGSLISVPPRVVLRGHLDSGGVPDTVVEWKITSIPVLVFAGAADAGMKDLHLRFTGVTPARFPYGDVALLSALGFRPTFPYPDQMSGGNYEMFSFALLFDSEHCVFENLIFDSATRDNQHVFGFALNVKGKGVRVAGGAGGLTGLAEGNRFSRIRLYDDVMGFLISGQENLVVEDVTADRRGSTASIAPGHVIYFTGSNLFSPDGKPTVAMSRNIRVTNLSEGPHTYSNIHSLGTLAIKYVDGGVFEHIASQHPAGLIQSLAATQNLTFTDLKWSSDAAICEEGADSCGAPVINSVVSKPGEPPIMNLRFTNIQLSSSRESLTTNLTGRTIELDGIRIETPPAFRKTPNQSAPGSVLGLRDASDVTIRNFVYLPVLTSFDPGAAYNQPLVCWGACTNIKADVSVRWPRGVALPPAGHRAITSGIQFDKPGANNSIVSRTEIN